MLCAVYWPHTMDHELVGVANRLLIASYSSVRATHVGSQLLCTSSMWGNDGPGCTSFWSNSPQPWGITHRMKSATCLENPRVYVHTGIPCVVPEYAIDCSVCAGCGINVCERWTGNFVRSKAVVGSTGWTSRGVMIPDTWGCRHVVGETPTLFCPHRQAITH